MNIPQLYHTLRRPTACFSALIVLLLSPSLLLADGPRQPGLYIPPAASYILNPGETAVQLQFDSVPLATVQTQLDAARAANPGAPIVLTLTGYYWVRTAPLTLPSNTSVVLYGTIAALPGATASSLISVSGQSKVAIAGGVLEGNFANLSGIDAETSTKINIDAVTIRNTGRDAIVLNGNGNTTFDSGSAITRCDIAGSAGNGITVSNITQTLLLDNFVHGNKGTGVQLSAAHSSVTNNEISHNNIGVLADANNNLISDNDVSGNMQAGVQLASTSSSSAIMRNIISHNGANGIDFDGSDNLVYNNTLSNQTDLTDRSAANYVVAHGTPLNAPTSKYFYPPTIDNQHNDPILNGVSRADITVGSGNLTDVQTAYNAALAANPASFIVLHMNGTFTMDGTTPLTLSSNTAVLLNGTINVTSKPAQVITDTNPASFVSISGGTIDLHGQGGITGIYFPSTTMVNIDHVSVINGGVPTIRTSGGMIQLQRGGGYNILYRNTVNMSGGRCLWTQYANAHYVVLENQLSSCNMDGVDFDSSTSNSYAIGNINIDNVRYGVFIEQSDSYNKIYGNYTTTRDYASSTGHGIGVYNNATSGSKRAVTNGNTAFSNINDVVNNGLRIGSISTATGGIAESANTYFFNNLATNNGGNAILFDTQFPGSVQNYLSQTVLAGNKNDLSQQNSNGATPPEFFNPMSAIDLALRQPVTASSTATGSDPANAVDGLAFTGWTAGSGSDQWVTIDLGSDVSFQRVVLKPSNLLSFLQLVRLQTSEDGINFTNIRGGIEFPGSVRTFIFKPVTARYLRVNIRSLFGLEISLRELGVYPN
ncbi:right-handed parallel beta-helix repeat-containing protein [Edaphobacter flagellatus]|uniref:right-handed parallel beta-helix repeat-containing protein n=1 Tax=Edaphobacter flagellatus TaxID=1933044 RepID=UPI0021B3198C|nr:right-handed parallel beta-helix repeat-containing protein [Edaphobacter flagellatus]